MRATSNNRIEPGHEPIAGYVLEELIGRGGYGEVWRAEAPGGMKKAVKFVFGNMDEQRSQQELKSLERIKGVQHPFILGLERFEIVDDQLVIVTELAEGSLEDVFRKHCDRGSCGIPRGTLLSFMRDAADALDYIHQLYQLQHLDIKPGNLLIVGGRIKVADFGLLKDLQEVDCSVIGGLTPIYAPPELFDGKPSMRSDQYSMAVMYQELLTGTRPFSGRTIAQLATQHVHNAPNLEPLPPRDRPCVARALEKSPDRRYASCSEFIASLSQENLANAADSPGATALHQGDTCSISPGSLPAMSAASVEDLPQLGQQPDGETEQSTSHAVVVGLGGIASDCLSTLFSKIGDETDANLPTLHTVFIDTSESAVRVIRSRSVSEHLPTNLTVPTPLRSPNEYRNRDVVNLRSMSRRWLYNAPRSGVTEGIRPLGRLALLDHWPKVLESLQTAIENVKQMSGGVVPRVYLVGSLAGGTSSGMYLDVVHTLRHLLDESGLADAEILSLLATTPLAIDPSRPLALHDTYASLLEIEHFMRPGNGFPGDEMANIPSVPAARSPLNNIYLISASQSPSAPKPGETLAEYLWFDATVGHGLLDAARASASDESASIKTRAIRSVGIIPLECTNDFARTVLVPIATRSLLTRWLGSPANAKERSESAIESIQQRCGLTPDAMIESVIQSYGSDHDRRSQSMYDIVSELSVADINKTKFVTLALMTSFAKAMPAENALSDVQGIANKLNREIKSRLRSHRLDIVSTIETIRLLTRAVRKVEVELRSRSESITGELSVNGRAPVGSADTDPIRQQINEGVKLGHKLLRAYASRIAAARAAALCKKLAEFEAQVSESAKVLAKAIRVNRSSANESGKLWESTDGPMQKRIEHLIEDIHLRTASPWLVNLVGDESSSPSATEILAALNSAATTVIDSHSVSRTSVLVEQLSDDVSDFGIEDALEMVRPKLLSCGGKQRLILVAGNQQELNGFASEIQKTHAGELTSVVIDSAEPILIHEAQQISIESVMAKLSSLNPGDAQVSQRLLTRTDIKWAMQSNSSEL